MHHPIFIHNTRPADQGHGWIPLVVLAMIFATSAILQQPSPELAWPTLITLAAVGAAIGSLILKLRRDATLRHEEISAARAELRELGDRENALRRLLDAADAAIIALDDEMCVREWNHGAERLLGLPRCVALGRPLPGLLEDQTTIDEQALSATLHALQDGAEEGVATLTVAGGDRTIELRFSRRQRESRDGADTVVLGQEVAHDGRMGVVRDDARSIPRDARHEFNNQMTVILGNLDYLRHGPFAADGAAQECVIDIADAARSCFTLIEASARRQPSQHIAHR